MPKVTDAKVGFEITGDFPHAAWTEWMTYTGVTGGAQPFSLVKDSAITPDQGSVNPFVPGTAVLADNRSYRLLILPKGTDQSTIAAPLRDVPASNVLFSPTTGYSFAVANRVYNAFPGYNQGGAGGPKNIAVPDGASRRPHHGRGRRLLEPQPDPEPAAADGRCRAPVSRPPARSPSPTARPWGAGPGAGSSGYRRRSTRPSSTRSYIEFTRPPLIAGADVSSIPPPDSCAGYLGAATSTSQIGLIRIPKVATWFDTSNLTPSSTFVQEDTTYISLTQYGASPVDLCPGRSRPPPAWATSELLLDSSGGSTVVVWPRTLPDDQQQQVFALAKKNGWALRAWRRAGRCDHRQHAPADEGHLRVLPGRLHADGRPQGCALLLRRQHLVDEVGRRDR